MSPEAFNQEEAELRLDAEEIRADLADTVDALAAKADLTGRVRQKVDNNRNQARATAGELGEQARSRAHEVGTQLRGSAAAISGTAEAVGGRASEQVSELTDLARNATRHNPVPVLAVGLAVLTAVLVVIRRRRAEK